MRRPSNSFTVARRIGVAVIAAVAMVSLASTSFAADVVNNDNKAHTVLVTMGANPGVFVVKRGQTRAGICNACTVTVQGVGTVSVSGGDKIVIRNGRLIKRAARTASK